MRTGSNHEYREARRFVEQAYLARKYNAAKYNYTGDFVPDFIDEAARRWGVTRRTIKRWIKAQAKLTTALPTNNQQSAGVLR